MPEVKEAAEELGMTPAQVIISWHVQRGVRSPVTFISIGANFQIISPQTVVLPKSVHANRVAENIGGVHFVLSFVVLIALIIRCIYSEETPAKSFRCYRSRSNCTRAYASR